MKDMGGASVYRPLDVVSVIQYVRDHPQAGAHVDTAGELEAIEVGDGKNAPFEENLRKVVLGG
jgi:hypothetical protein